MAIREISRTHAVTGDTGMKRLPQQLPRLNQLLHGPRRGKRTAIDNATLTIRPLVKIQDGGRTQPRKMLADLFEMITAEHVIRFAETGTPRHGQRF